MDMWFQKILIYCTSNEKNSSIKVYMTEFFYLLDQTFTLFSHENQMKKFLINFSFLHLRCIISLPVRYNTGQDERLEIVEL